MVELIQYLDGIIILAGISVFGMQKALYAMVALFIATKVSENIVEGVKFSKQLWIISQHTDAIAQRIIVEMDRGVTGVKARGMYSKADKEILFCVVSVKEIVAIKDLVAQVDKDAFVIVSDAREVFGEGFLDKDE